MATKNRELLYSCLSSTLGHGVPGSNLICKEIIVASFCSKCGIELSPGAQSCASCGTPVAAPMAAPVAATTPVQPAASGNNTLKIVLIIVGIFVGLGILAAGAFGFVVWRVAHSVHVSHSGDQVTLNTPGGSISANTNESFTASEIGTDIYPGATTGKGGMRMTLPTGTMVTAIYVTADSKDQVLAFYKDKLGSGASSYESGEGAVVTANKDNDSVVVTITPNASEYDGKTQIAIVHTKSNKGS
jgi:nitrate reductase NapE component